jgi:hypothetical protein
MVHSNKKMNDQKLIGVTLALIWTPNSWSKFKKKQFMDEIEIWL